ncbi:MAG: GatB/YqeY domain-containing protein [Deltaproteobacteria bacterium]
MTLRDTVASDMTASLKAGDKERLGALRLLLSAVKYKELDLRRPLTDEEVHGVVATLVRQRHDSIEQFKNGNRLDLAEKEEREIGFFKPYQAIQLSADELGAIVKKIAAQIGATGIKDMGTLMKAVMAEAKGKADGKLINDVVKQTLGG